jgi:uncharacterized protein
MFLKKSLTEAELLALDDFLHSEAMPAEGMDLPTLDGFLAAILLNPELIRPSEWLSWVADKEKGEAEPNFKDEKEMERIIGAILTHYNAINTAIQAGEFTPTLHQMTHEDGSVGIDVIDAGAWSQGFLLGVAGFNRPWRQLIDELPELLTPMFALGTEEGASFIAEHADPEQDRIALALLIPETVTAIHAFFAPLREKELARELKASSQAGPGPAPRPKVGRNEPCPCGSGRKYKKCCGAA